MSEPATCGYGLAAHSALHAKLADLLAAVGKNLELHLTSLDPEDEQSSPEVDAYTSLVKQHRDLAARLPATADELASYRDLPMANHDMEVLMSPAAVEAFRELITAQKSVAELLDEWAERDRQMLESE